MWEMHIGFWVCTFICSWTLLLALDRKTGTLLKISVQLSSPKASNVLIATNPRCSTCCHEKEYPLKDIERLPPNRDYTSQFIFETFPSAHVRGTVWVHWMQLGFPSFLSGWRWQSSPPSSSIFTSSQASDQWWQCTFQGFLCACCGTASSSMTSMASSIIMYMRSTSVQPVGNSLSGLIESVTSGKEGLVLNMHIWFWFLLFQILCFS